MVTIEGQVVYPGPYALTGSNMRLLDVINQAGGLTPDAFPKGAYLMRKDDDVGVVITRLDEVLKNPASKFNYILKEGDVINIPKVNDIVTIMTAGTNANDLYKNEIVNNGRINVPLSKNKRANWYLKEYAVGIQPQPDKRSFVVVEYPNGEIKRTKDFVFFRIYPKPTQGSIIRVGYKDMRRQKKDKKDKKPVDWEKVAANTLAQVTAIVTLIVLVQRIN